ncbi:uncharacterized protein LOC123533120 [Mercenaria mercenaria]|uniref:uncharacterized protein LOC123533120 n=1 Tax=Mercenaria mercenaria TaxID=6596 RepID=UPI00234E40BB|nr:uncharacterized protein LOC123533120 [Mercenaria mercenaria]
MEKESTGCFAWIVSLKQSCNERWARFRNRLRRRFYARRGQTVDPSTIVNETGTRDMVITKTPYKKNKVLPEVLATPRANEECPMDAESAQATGIHENFEKLVGDYVSRIISNAADTLLTERQASLGNKNVILENTADDISLSPSIISQIADTAVSESLSNILESNLNQSAIHNTIKEFMVQKSLELLAEKLVTVNLLSGYKVSLFLLSCSHLQTKGNKNTNSSRNLLFTECGSYSNSDR